MTMMMVQAQQALAEVIQPSFPKWHPTEQETKIWIRSLMKSNFSVVDASCQEYLEKESFSSTPNLKKFLDVLRSKSSVFDSKADCLQPLPPARFYIQCIQSGKRGPQIGYFMEVHTLQSPGYEESDIEILGKANSTARKMEHQGGKGCEYEVVSNATFPDMSNRRAVMRGKKANVYQEN